MRAAFRYIKCEVVGDIATCRSHGSGTRICTTVPCHPKPFLVQERASKDDNTISSLQVVLLIQFARIALEDVCRTNSKCVFQIVSTFCPSPTASGNLRAEMWEDSIFELALVCFHRLDIHGGRHSSKSHRLLHPTQTAIGVDKDELK